MEGWEKYGKILLLMGAILLVIAMTVPIDTSMSQKKSGMRMNKNKFPYRAYIPHGIIRINSNGEFAQIAQNEGWQGDGSENSPYVIEGYEIDAHGEGNAIYIGNTTVYFIIRNCYLHNATDQIYPYFAGAGITLYNVTKGKLENNTCSNNYGGICLSHSSNNLILNNTCSYNNIYSIYLDSSSSNVISSNICSNNNWFGIYLYFSNNNVISNNACNHNDESGTILDHSSSNLISNNTCSNNGYYGIWMYSSSNDNNIIINNLISNNTNYGIYIYSGCSHNRIYNNSFYYNDGSENTFNSLHIQAYDGGSNNYWNSSTGIGNYWHDWANNNNTNDQNGDGIVDWPYPIAGSAGAKDYYPLKNPTIVPEFSLFDLILILLVSLAIFYLRVRKEELYKQSLISLIIS